jgi:two-component system, LytTR family, sensor kinase
MPSSDDTLHPRGGRPLERRIWLVIAAACTIPAALDALQTYFQARLNGEPARWQDLVFQGTEWLFLGALTPITYYLGQRVPLRRERWIRAVAVHVAGAGVLCVAWASLGVALGYALGRYPAGNYASWVLTTIPWSVFMYFTVLGCVHAFAYFFEAREREAHASRLAAQLAQARLDALRMQLHPHFLFNSLNAIAVLVREQNTTAAAQMLELLADVLRQVLRADPSHERPLADELLFLERYLAIEEVRFSDRLRAIWRIDDRARSAIVPEFVMQPLVENAIKHGLARRADAGRITISARIVRDSLVLSVEDDGPGMTSAQLVEGVGLSNTRERLRTLYGDRTSMTIESPEGGGTRITLTMPFRVRAE